MGQGWGAGPCQREASSLTLMEFPSHANIKGFTIPQVFFFFKLNSLGKQWANSDKKSQSLLQTTEPLNMLMRVMILKGEHDM